jgi:hypothetical protein
MQNFGSFVPTRDFPIVSCYFQLDYFFQPCPTTRDKMIGCRSGLLINRSEPVEHSKQSLLQNVGAIH